MNDELREELAAYAHEAWSGWMKYIVSKLRFVCQKGLDGDGEVEMWLSNGLRHRWGRQMKTPYCDLPESEKDSDRKEADRILAIINKLPPWEQQIPGYMKWRSEADQVIALDQFDLALGWFSGKGYPNEDALEAAKFMQRCGGSSEFFEG